MSGGELRNTNRQAQVVREKTLAQQVGIQLSLAALLKNSQIFTGFVGAIFQILGAMFDIALAPMAPIIVRVLSWMGQQFPVYHAYVQATIPRALEYIRGIRDMMGQISSKIVRPVFSLFDKDGVSADGRLKLSDIISGLGAAVLGQGIFNALRTNATALVGATVSGMMTGTMGAIFRTIRRIGMIGLMFSGINMIATFKEQGVMAGLQALGEFIATTIAAAIGAFIGSIFGPIGAIVGSIGAAMFTQKMFFPPGGGAIGNPTVGGGGAPSSSSAQGYGQYIQGERMYNTSVEQGSVSGESQFDFDKKRADIGARGLTR